MIMVLCEKKVVVLASKKKIEFFKEVLTHDLARFCFLMLNFNMLQLDLGSDGESGIPPFSFLVRDKNDKDRTNFKTIIESIKSSGKVNKFCNGNHV